MSINKITQDLSAKYDSFTGSRLLGIKEVCFELGISKPSFYRAFYGKNNKEHFPEPIKLLSNAKWRMQDVQAWIDSQFEEAEAA